MALLQISEPGQSTVPHQRNYAAGIDLGTTNSLVAVKRSGQVETLADEEGRHLLPSIVHYAEDEVLVGYPAQVLQAFDPLNTLSSVKRIMGRGVADLRSLDDVLPYQFDASVDSTVPRIKTRNGNVSAGLELAAGEKDALAALVEGLAHALGLHAHAVHSGWCVITGIVATVPGEGDRTLRLRTQAHLLDQLAGGVGDGHHHVLRDVHQAPCQVTGVRSLQGGIRKALVTSA